MTEINMKTLKYFLAGTILLSASACGDNWLDLESSTSVQTEQTVQILSDVDFVLNGIYSTMQNAYAYSGRLVYYGDVTGDDMQAYKSTSRSGNYYLFQFTKDNSPSTFWSYPYYMISMCNLILEKIDGLETDDEELRDYYKGQALALRGMFLFDLTRFYGYPYKKDNGASLGVPIVTKVLSKDEKPARNTVAQCYEAVIGDLKEACNLMNTDTGKDFEKGHINYWGAMSLLSRVYLYHGDDALALSTAEATIEGAEAEDYHLWSNGEYAQAWGYDVSESDKGEVLFEVVNTTDDSPGNESLGRLHGTSGYYDIHVTSSFYVMMQEDPKDVRNKLFTYKSSRAYVNKYQPQEGENIRDANIPLLRLSETYLNAAEAAVKTGDNTKAVKYLDAIVNRANPDKTVQGTTVTLEQVMTERRKELVAEGHRMFDALRDGGEVNRYDAAKLPSKISKNEHLDEQTVWNFDWNYYKCVLAIPRAEMDANENMVQNPTYDAPSQTE